ncbi:MAG TPA: hypothetical protein VFA50_11255 [Stellaceae bacterium]|nr:hypothetical protein [Stellaceae bacterium]
MAKDINVVIYGKKDGSQVKLAQYDGGKLVAAVAADLLSSGLEAQGLPVKESAAKSLVDAVKKDKNVKAPYAIAGIAGNDLLFQVRDTADKKFVKEAVVVKDYVKIKKTLAEKKKHAVVNVHDDKSDDTIKTAAKVYGNKLGVKPQTDANADFGGVTGDIVLTAHGTPKILPGRVIGAKLGMKTPQQIVAILTGNPDKKKNIGKNYGGKIYLAGCFTAAGGPEGEKQDDAFAKQVWDLLKKSGYTKLSVIGYPGASATANNQLVDDHGTPMKRGEERTVHAMEDDEGKAADLLKLQQLTDALDKYAAKFAGKPEALAKDATAARLLKAIEAQEQNVRRARDTRQIANLQGQFGLQLIKKKPWYKSAFG